MMGYLSIIQPIITLSYVISMLLTCVPQIIIYLCFYTFSFAKYTSSYSTWSDLSGINGYKKILVFRYPYLPLSFP